MTPRLQFGDAEPGLDYRERPTAVTQALFARSDKLRTFADAFRLRKD